MEVVKKWSKETDMDMKIKPHLLGSLFHLASLGLFVYFANAMEDNTLRGVLCAIYIAILANSLLSQFRMDEIQNRLS